MGDINSPKKGSNEKQQPSGADIFQDTSSKINSQQYITSLKAKLSYDNEKIQLDPNRFSNIEEATRWAVNAFAQSDTKLANDLQQDRSLIDTLARSVDLQKGVSNKMEKDGLAKFTEALQNHPLPVNIHIDDANGYLQEFTKANRDMLDLYRNLEKLGINLGKNNLFKQRAEESLNDHKPKHEKYVTDKAVPLIRDTDLPASKTFSNFSTFEQAILEEIESKDAGMKSEINNHKTDAIKQSLLDSYQKHLKDLFKNRLNTYEQSLSPDKHFDKADDFSNEFLSNNRDILDQMKSPEGTPLMNDDDLKKTINDSFNRVDKKHNKYLEDIFDSELAKIDGSNMPFEFSNEKEFTENLILNYFGSIRLPNGETLGRELQSHKIFENHELLGKVHQRYMKINEYNRSKVKTECANWIKIKDIDPHGIDTPEQFMDKFAKDNPQFAKVLGNKDNQQDLIKFFDDALGKLKEAHEKEEKECKKDIREWYAENKAKLDAHEIGGAEGMKKLYLASGRNKKFLEHVGEDHHADDFDPLFTELFEELDEEHEKEEAEAKKDIETWIKESDLDAHEISGPEELKKLYLASGRNKKFIELVGEDHHADDFDPEFAKHYKRLREEHDNEMKEMEQSMNAFFEKVRSGEFDFDPEENSWEKLRELYFQSHPEHKKEMMEDHHERMFGEKFEKEFKNLEKLHRNELGKISTAINRWNKDVKEGRIKLSKDFDEISANEYMQEYLRTAPEKFRKEIMEPHHMKGFFDQFKRLTDYRKEDFKKQKDEVKKELATWFDREKSKIDPDKTKKPEEIMSLFIKSHPKAEQWKSLLMKPEFLREFGNITASIQQAKIRTAKGTEGKISSFAQDPKIREIKNWEEFRSEFLKKDPKYAEQLRKNPVLAKKLKAAFEKKEGKSVETKESEERENISLQRQYFSMIQEKLISRTISVDTAIKYREWFNSINNKEKKEAIKKFPEDMEQRDKLKWQFENSIPQNIRDKHPDFYNLGQSARKKLMGEIAREMGGEKPNEIREQNPEAAEVRKMEVHLISVLSENVREKNISPGTYQNFREWFQDSSFEGKKQIMELLAAEMKDRTEVKRQFENLPKDIQEKNQHFYDMGGYPRQLLMKDIRKQMETKGENMPSTEEEKALSEKLLGALKSKLDINLARKIIAPAAHKAFLEWFEESDMEEREKIVDGLDKEMERRKMTLEAFKTLPQGMQELNQDFYELRQYPREQRLKQIEQEIQAGSYDEILAMEAGDDEPASTPNRMPIEMDKLRALFPQNFRRFYEYLQYYNTKQFEVFLRKGIVNKRPQQFIPRLFENFKFKQRFTMQCHKDPLLKQDFLRGLEKLGIQNPWETKKKKEDIDNDIAKNQEVEKGSASYKFYEQNKEELIPDQKEDIEKKETVKSEMMEINDEVKIPEEEVMKKEEQAEETNKKEEAPQEIQETENVEQEVKQEEVAEEEKQEPETQEQEIEEITEKIQTEQKQEDREQVEEPQDQILKDLLRIAREKEIGEETENKTEAENEDNELADMIAIIDLLKSRKGLEKKKILIDEKKDKKTRLRETKQDAESALAEMINSLSDPNAPFDDSRASKVTELLVSGRLAFVSPRVMHSLISKLFAMPIEKNTLKPKLKSIIMSDQPNVINVAALYSVFQEIFLTGRETLIEFVRKFSHYACHILDRNIETVIQIHSEAGNMIVRDQKDLFELLLKDFMDVRDKDLISRFAFSAEDTRKYLEIMNIRIVFGIHLGKKIALSFHEATLVTEEYLKGIAQEQRKML